MRSAQFRPDKPEERFDRAVADDRDRHRVNH